jgi:membrane-bound lytic murein transglycosylase D
MKITGTTSELLKGMVSRILPLVILAFLPLALSAQVVVEEEDDEPDEEDEITVTDQSGQEEVIEFPEAMTYDLDSLLNLYMAKTYLDAEDCNFRDVNPEYTKEDYMERLYRMPCVMEMAYNDVVRQFIDRYAGRLRHSVAYMLGASNFYIPIFEEALETYQLPLELKYLPIIESALNPKAVSRVGATGLWQFMLATGKQYDLKVNSLVDERRDPVKSSYAAARYLRDLYKIFGDWNLVIAAYNCGPGNISKAIHRAGNENKDYWHIYPYLPRETRGYVPAFIAANYIMTYYSLHNICPMTTRLPAQTDTVMVNRNLHLEQVAEVLGLNIDMLRSLNPMYRRDVIPGATEPCPLRLPQAEISKFLDMEDSVYNYRADELLNKRVQVEVNDDVPTYYHKSKRYTRGKKTYRRKTSSVRRRTSAVRKRTSASKRRSSARKRTTKRRRR